MFDRHIYIERRRRLKDEMKSGLALFLGNDESPMNYPDNTFHYRQDSTFLYYFGLDHAGLVAEPTAFLFQASAHCHVD